MRALQRRLPALVVALGIAVALAGTEDARAQSAADAAREAFSAGLAAESAGRHDEACVSFRRSLALVRELGPLQKAAACDEREGKLRSATALLEELLSRLPAGDGERAPVEERLRVARSRLGLVTITIRPGAPTALRARLDGTPIALPAEDIMVDPGRRELAVDVPGKGVELTEIEVAAGGRAAVTVPAEDAASEARPPAPPPVAERPSPSPAEPSHPLRTAGWIVGGVGLAGVVGVVATGIPLLGKSSDFDDCKGDFACEDGVSTDASPLVAVNTVMWAVGIAGVGLGATLLIVDSAGDDAASIGATIGPGGATVRGRF